MIEFDNIPQLKKPLPKFEFDLDKSPEERWGPIFDANHDRLDIVKKEIKKILNSYCWVRILTKPLVCTLRSTCNIPFMDEVDYIAKRYNLEYDEVISMQLIYESSSACTTAIFQSNDKNNIVGSDLFLRTMDWEMPFLKDITIELDVRRKNKCIANAVTWLGYVGVLTVTVDPDGFVPYCIAVNYRKTKEMTLSAIVCNAIKNFNSIWPIGYLVRDIAYSGSYFDIAIDKLKHKKLVAPCYITIFVPNGPSAIITRDVSETVHLRNNQSVQTNCDWDRIEPNILWSLERRKLIQKTIDKWADLDHFSTTDAEDILREVLVFPVINPKTIYIYFYFKGKISGYLI